MNLKEVELHIHLIQSLYPEDLFELGKYIYKEIDWNRFAFLERYENIFGIKLDPVAIFERAIKTGSLDEIKEVCVYKYSPTGKFEEFDIKSFFPYCITGYYYDNDIPEKVLELIIRRHKQEGIKYIEYRNGFGGSGQEWKEWHTRFARYIKNSCTDDFTAKYIIRLGKYQEFKEIMNENPDLWDIIVGVDFSGREISPHMLKEFYQEIKVDREQNPERTPDVVVHIGENFFDKSLESAIRWVHETALFGASRVAHCIVLGLKPEEAINRRVKAHTEESVEERIYQISYDLENKEMLARYGVIINESELKDELCNLLTLNKDETITKEYDSKRLLEIEKRQDLVLDELTRLGVVIEVCPTSNLCIGGVPSIESHSLIKIINSNVKMVICTDDPGIFDQSLTDELTFVSEQFGFTSAELASRIGNPFDYKLK